MKITVSNRVRAYDVDGRGVATVASLLHYAEDSRLALALDLHTRDVAYPLRNLARVQHLVVVRPLPMLAPFEATSFVTRVGGTSFDVGTILALEGEVAVYVRITFVAVDAEGAKTEVDRRMHAAVVDTHVPLGPGVPDALAQPRFERLYTVLPRDENSGRHVSHARLAEQASEHLRVGVSEHALDARADGPVAAMSIVYDRETRFPDALRITIGEAETGVFDVLLARTAGPHVARARFVTKGV
jgi:acyl-CoA thioesterase FadM